MRMARMPTDEQKRRVAELLEFAASIKVPRVIEAELGESEGEGEE